MPSSRATPPPATAAAAADADASPLPPPPNGLRRAAPLRQSAPPPASHAPPAAPARPAPPSPEVAASLSALGAHIARLARVPSDASLASDARASRASRASQHKAAAPAPAPAPTDVVPNVSTTREALTLKQVSASVVALRSAAPTQVFRVKDEQRRRRYKVVHPGAAVRGAGAASQPPAPELLVVDAAGRPVWSVRPGRSAAAKVLVKPGSDYHIALVRRHWVPYLARRVEGVAFRYGTRRVVFVVKGDALGRRFSVHAGADLIAQAHRTTQIAQPGRKLTLSVADLSTAHFTVAIWNLAVSPGVDTALMTAVLSVLETWTVEMRLDGERRKGATVDGAGSAADRPDGRRASDTVPSRPPRLPPQDIDDRRASESKPARPKR